MVVHVIPEVLVVERVPPFRGPQMVSQLERPELDVLTALHHTIVHTVNIPAPQVWEELVEKHA